MPLRNVPVLLEAAQRWLDPAPREFVTAPCKRIAINAAAKRSRTTQFQIHPVKVCPKGEGGPRFRGGLVAFFPGRIDCRTRRLALRAIVIHLTTATHRRRKGIGAEQAGLRW